MIPLRITLKGFMSYRDEVTFSFDGKPLWMLAGPNGAGKSAVFDAMTYALYAHHRLGGQKHVELIHKRADSMSVEFEFACGDDIYAVKRTLAREGQPSREVFHIKGPHAPNPNRVGPQAVPETSSDWGFNLWVTETIGLSYETFIASVLLRQGNSDALLEADPAKRHEMLGQIVDLSAYKRLYDEADKRRKRFEGEKDILQGQLRELAPVDECELAELAERAAAQGAAMHGSQKRLLHLAGLKVHAGHWMRLTGDQTEVRKALDEARGLLVQAERIEREATRFDELRRVVPLLNGLLDARDRLQKTDRKIERYAQDIDALRQQELDCKDAQATQGRIVEDLKAQQEGFDRAQREAQRLLLALGPQMERIKRMDRVQGETADIDRALAAFAPDLDEQCATLTGEVDELTELKGVVLPWLGRFVNARNRWRGAQADIRAAQHRLADIKASLPADMIAQGVTSAAEWYKRAQAEVTRAGTLLGQEEGRLDRLQQVEGKPLCSYCGQDLRPEYIADEQRRIDAAIQEAKIAQEQAADACKRATTLKKSEQSAEQDLQKAHAAVEQAERDGEGALAELPEAYRARIVPVVVSDSECLFAQNYPAEEDIVELRSRADQLDAVKQRLRGIQEEARKRDIQRGQREPLAKELVELEGQYPPNVAAEARAGFEREQARCQETEQGLEDLLQPLDEAEAALAAANRSVEDVDKQLRETEASCGQATALRQDRERNVAERQAAVPEEWRPVCPSLTKERLTAWEEEAATLSGADARRDELKRARDEQENRERRLAQIATELAAIPEEGRCPLTDIEGQERGEGERHQAAQVAQRAAEDKLRQLETRRAQREDLTMKYSHANRQAYLYSELARLLGRDRLQRHLLQQAEMGIVAYANRTLDRISGSMLRLELRQSEATAGKVAGKGAAKALDLVAYKKDLGDAPLLVGALSGSQRFRVAVSLALGIGEYASRGVRRIETVIIDEGFGSLDQQGRRGIIQELHALKSVLKRIILVSHQEEFFNAFSNGYKIELVDGASQVSDLEVSAVD